MELKSGHYIMIGFFAVVGAKIMKGLLSGFLNVNF